MAEFIGTKKEFNRFFGPHLRNLIQNLTRKYRREIGKCEHCGTDQNLESAHITGKERIEIIDKIIEQYYSVNNYKVNLTEFEKKFKNEHENLSEVILILCSNCHSIYDNKRINSTQINEVKRTKQKKKNRIYSNTEIQIKLSEKLKNFQTNELEKFFNKDYCKEVFKINFPLLLKTKSNTPKERKKEMVKENGINRWTWKYEFEKDNYCYGICTQWFEWNDEFVKSWLNKN